MELALLDGEFPFPGKFRISHPQHPFIPPQVSPRGARPQIQLLDELPELWESSASSFRTFLGSKKPEEDGWGEEGDGNLHHLRAGEFQVLRLLQNEIH